MNYYQCPVKGCKQEKQRLNSRAEGTAATHYNVQRINLSHELFIVEYGVEDNGNDILKDLVCSQ